MPVEFPTPTTNTSTTTTAPARTEITFTNAGRLQHVSLSFMNDLISLLSEIPSPSFEEDLARLSLEQRYAQRVHKDKDVPTERQMLVVGTECEEYLRETLLKLRARETVAFEVLVGRYPGTEAIVDLRDPRCNEPAVLRARTNM